MSEWRRLCCAVDFSEDSRVALEEATALAARSGGELTVIHVVGGDHPRDDRLPYHSEVRSPHGGDPARKLEEWRAAAEQRVGRPVIASLLTGAAVDEILRFARRGRHDVLVIGTPGVRGHGRLAFESVAEEVIRHAPCTVVVARRSSGTSRSP